MHIYSRLKCKTICFCWDWTNCKSCAKKRLIYNQTRADVVKYFKLDHSISLNVFTIWCKKSNLVSKSSPITNSSKSVCLFYNKVHHQVWVSKENAFKKSIESHRLKFHQAVFSYYCHKSSLEVEIDFNFASCSPSASNLQIN